MLTCYVTTNIMLQCLIYNLADADTFCQSIAALIQASQPYHVFEGFRVKWLFCVFSLKSEKRMKLVTQ